jgi:hypothetical protein
MKFINTNYILKPLFLLATMVIIVVASFGSCKKELAKSSDANILKFTLKEQVDTAKIDKTNRKVEITVKYTSNVKKLVPVIEISQGASITPKSGDTVDFSSGSADFVITAEDKSASNWKVYITIEKSGLSGDNKILSIAIPGQIGEAVIKDTIYTFTMLANADLINIKPAITISEGALIEPALESIVDFSKGFADYTVTAKNGVKAMYRIYIVFKKFTADDNNIKYVGRVDFTDVKNPKFSNPGVYIKSKFTGTFCDIVIQVDNGQNYIQVVIDDKVPKRIQLFPSETAYRVADSLPNGDHSILICKETEAGVGFITFSGFRCEGLSPVTDMPIRKIECYGNSITCGAKMLFGTPCDYVNNQRNWQAANSAYLSYGAVTARALNAQWQLTSVSGIGLISSCCGMPNTMPDTYDRLDLNNSSSKKWDFTKYIPDIVTICLGQNDGSTIVASKEFKDKYIEFINTIRSKYRDASIFCLTSPMADSSGSSSCLFKVMQKSLTSIVDSINKAGDEKVYWVNLPHDQNHGCPGQGHPSEAEHIETAIVLEAAIKDKMGW